jgi:cytochrome c biogenesis protein CcmG/thiol:disulfide interchange protein DsbE
MSKYWLSLLAYGAALSLAGCNGGASVSDDDLALGGEKLTVHLLKDPVEIPPFTVSDINGKTLSSADWRGKVVLVNFWATWCGPCRVEIPDLIALQEKYRDQLVVLGISEEHPDEPNHVNDEKDIALVKTFADQQKINYPLALVTPELRALFPDIMALPTTFVLDREGMLVQKTVGLLKPKETEAAARHLAGLPANVEVVRVEPDKAIGVDNLAQITSVPGVDLSSIPSERRTAALVAMNEAECDCGCHLTVAKCRIDDPACAVSLPIAKTIVEKYAAAR